jgi:hypothetical protein
MGAALSIRDDLSPEALRRQARKEANRRAALRMSVERPWPPSADQSGPSR